MAFKATLKIGSTEFDVISCSYSFYREVDLKGRPSSIVYGGKVDVTVESTDDTSIIETMVNNQHKQLDATITWLKDDEDAKMKELTIEKAYIVAFSETFATGGGEGMTASFTLSAKTLKVGAAEHVNDWPEKK